jgi:regulator of nucleoside diphosphate kinase
VKSRCGGKPRPTLSPIVINARLFPRAARLLAREIDRASVVPDSNELRNVVRMGSEVIYRDEETGEVRNVRLVYPHEADIAHGRLRPCAGRRRSGRTGDRFGTPSHETRSIAVLSVSK